MPIKELEIKAASLMRKDENRLVHQMVRDFSTWEPFGQALRKQLNLIGYFFRIWLEAESALHFFSNTETPRVDFIQIGKNERDFPKNFQRDLIYVEESADVQEIKDIKLKTFCDRHLRTSGNRYLLLPFCKHKIPFGQFILSFKDDKFPSPFMIEKIRGTIDILRVRLRDLIYNHYPISRFTYLPSFQSQQTTEAGILFCDVRDSTSMFEIARMAYDTSYTDMLILLLKCFFEYASRIISVKNIGRIHRYMGDGFVATFGEYLSLDPAQKANAAGSLALLSAILLKDGFNRLWESAKKHLMNIEFLGVYNEDIDLRLGIGINYGSVRFDVFGITIKDEESSRYHRGYSEFTAIGDHMSFAQRLCSVANQPLSIADIVYRSEKLPQSRLTAPIIISRTVAFWIKACLTDKNPLDTFRSDFQLKGKGHPMPGYEIWENSPDRSELLRCISGIHKNHFFTALKDELENKQQLNKVNDRFINKLNEIVERRKNNSL